MEDVPGLEARIHALQSAEAANEQARAEHQHQGQRDLGRHERVPQDRVSRVGVGAATLLQGVVGVGVREPPRRQDAGQKPGDDRDAEGEGEHGQVDTDVGHAGHLVAEEGDDETHAEAGEKQSERAAGDREHDGLGEDRPDDARAAGPEGRAHRDLLAPRDRAGENEVGDVGARDQEHEAHGPEQDEQRRPDVADEVLVEGQDGGAPALVVRRVLRGQPGRDGVHLGPRRIQRDAVLQAGEHAEVVNRPQRPVLRRQNERDPDAGLRRIGQLLRKHAHDLVALAVQDHGASDDGGTGAEAALPHLLGDDRHILAGLVVAGGEGAADQRARAHDRKELARDVVGGDETQARPIR